MTEDDDSRNSLGGNNDTSMGGDDAPRFAAHLRAQEASSRKVLERIKTSKMNDVEDLQEIFEMDGILSSSPHGASTPRRMSRDYSASYYGVGTKVGDGSPPGYLRSTSTSDKSSSAAVGSSPAVPIATRGAFPPLSIPRVMTEDEVCAIQYDDYLSRSLNQDGSKSDPRDHLFEAIPTPFIEMEEFQRVHITETAEPPDEDTLEACKRLRTCLSLREKYINQHPQPPQDLKPPFNSSNKLVPPSPVKKDRHPNDFRRRAVPIYNVFDEPLPPKSATEHRFEMVKGIMTVTAMPGPANDTASSSSSSSSSVSGSSSSSTTTTTSIFPVTSLDEFLHDFVTLRRAVFCGPVISYSYTRLELLSARYNIHVLLNETRELVAQKSVPHRDFYNVRKVDTHVHHSACMSQKHLLRYIKHKLRFEPNEVVILRDGKYLTLGEVFMSLRLTAYDLSIDTLDMHAHNTFNRFDRFNLKYNPAGQSRLREIFLKTDNLMKGKYLAEITREVMGDLEASKYQLVEWRVSIYGRKATEWDGLSRWFMDNKLAHPNVRWLIQVPRLFANYRSSGEVASFQDFLSNFFGPLFAVTEDPASNPALHYFLETVVGIDSVDDESKPEHGHLNSGAGTVPTPDVWTEAENPPFGYWMYYFWANLVVLNKFRESRGLRTFEFRPHCGEAGDLDHLVSAYLCAHKINHGILLRKSSSLQYLYYLSQIGIAMSPLSNNKLFLDYHKNPFPRYFQQGLHVSLSTDDPLMLHYTKDPLLEEFSVAAQVWKLSSADQCEIARNSVLQSGWERRYKLHFLGADLSDIRETNVPKIRLMFRQETLQAELAALVDKDPSTAVC